MGLFRKKNATKEKLDKELDPLLQDLKKYVVTWGVEDQIYYKRSAKTAWIIATIATLLAALSIIALSVLFTANNVVPIPVIVDRISGKAEVMTEVDNVKLFSSNEAINRYWINKYVIARESYNYYTVEQDYGDVLFMTVGTSAQNAYKREAHVSSPLSPIIKYSNKSNITIDVHNIVFTKQSVDPKGKHARVRFSKNLVTDGNIVSTEDYYAEIQFKYYFDQQLSEKGRLRNPLGFAVNSYIKEKEL